MNSNSVRIRLAADHAAAAHLYTGAMAYILSKAEKGKGFHTLTDEERGDLRQAIETAVRQTLRAASILADLNHFTAAVTPYYGTDRCQCEQPARWAKPITIRGKVARTLHLCDLCLVKDEDNQEYTVT